ncbi:MAG: ribonuclease Y [Phycisphaerae bacterium]|nr:ribonuclease Y [Phycisphaerae bacterium]
MNVLASLIPFATVATPQTGAQAAGFSPVATILLVLFCSGFAAGAAILIRGMMGRQTLASARQEAEQIRERARADAKAEGDKALLDAEREALARREKSERELEASRDEVREGERRLQKREDLLHRKEETVTLKEQSLTDRASDLDKQKAALDARTAEIDDLRSKQETKLQQIAGLSRDEAKAELLARVEETSRQEVAKVVRTVTETAEAEAKEKARELTIMAVQRFAMDHASESTVRSVAIPSDDMKGRIIGREGRNIRAIEKATGVDIIVDDTPGVIVVSSFDKVRQAVAVESLERLIADGRMHPTRIEEVVEKVRSEVEEKILKAGKDAAIEVKLGGLHPKIIEAMGKLHYRTSYGQNVLKHSIEVGFLSQIIADQLGLDGKLARRCGFLHDIGKAMDHEMEGGHPKIGMDFAKQHGEKDEAVLNAIGGHHADIPSTTFYTPIVMAADAVSSARPGARRESMERYVQRLNELQDIALAQPGVVEAYAIQAGREVRVMVDAEHVGDDEAYLIAHEIAKRVSDEMTFPGEIRVTVLRETRAIELAR